MKSYLIAVGLCAVLMGCGSSPSTPDGKTSPVGDPGYSYDTPGESYVGQCDRPSFTTFVVDGQTVVVETPSLCNQGPDPYHGDPCPDCGDPNPEDKVSNPGDKVTIKSFKVNVNVEQQQRNAR